MRYVDVIRHAKRRNSEHLSDEGVLVARSIGEQLGPYRIVASTSEQRAIETPVAMGFAVHEEQAGPGMRKFEEGADWQAHIAGGFPELSRLYRKGGQTTLFAEAQAKLWMSIASRLEEGEMALVVSHKGPMEVGAIGALPGSDHDRWGGPFENCEGIRLGFDGERFTEGRIFRIEYTADGAATLLQQKA